MSDILILDGSLRIRIYYECDDCDFEDNICVSILEDCPENEKLFKADETNIFLTPDQARMLAVALIDAANQSLGMGTQDSAP